MGGSIRLIGKVGVAAAAIALLWTPAAQAGGQLGTGFATKTNTVAVTGTGAIGSSTATCPKRTRAVSGGFATSPNPTLFSAPSRVPVIYETHRAGPRAWIVSVSNLGSGTTNLTTLVYCRAEKTKEVVSSVPINGAGRAASNAVATCPKGTKVLSGGYQLPPLESGGSLVYPTMNQPSGPSAWSVIGVRTTTAGAAGTVTSYAYCAKSAGGGSKQKTVVANGAAGTNVYLGVTTQPCQKSKRATGGGFTAPFVDSGSIRDVAYVTTLERSGRAWRAFAIDFGALSQVSLTAIAVCRP